MIETLRIVHLLAMAVGLGATVSAMIVARLGAGRAPEILGPIQIRLAQWGFLALIALWLTGSALLAEGHDPETLSPLFWVKMAAVLVLTGAGVAMQLAIKRLPPPERAARAALLRPIMALSAVAALALAVFSFG